MVAYALRRFVAAIPVVVAIIVIAFLVIRVGPGDPSLRLADRGAASLGQSADPSSRSYASAEDVAAVRERLGLDRPLLEQFVTWLDALMHGSFGESFVYGEDVARLIGQRVEPTLSLAFATTLISLAIGIPLGLAAAARRGGLLDRSIQAFCLLGFSVPAFVAGYVLIYVLSLRLGWFPAQGYTPFAEGLLPWAWRLTLPSLSLAFVFIALIASMTRTSVIEVLGEDYIRTARAKGVPRSRILGRHALRNAASPILTVVGIGIAVLLGGVVVTESVFNIPGLGRLTTDAVLASDYPVVQAVVLLSALVHVGVNLVIDLLYGVVDPRVRS